MASFFIGNRKTFNILSYHYHRRRRRRRRRCHLLGINHWSVFGHDSGCYAILYLVGGPRYNIGMLCLRNEQRRGSRSEQNRIYKTGTNNDGWHTGGRQQSRIVAISIGIDRILLYNNIIF